MTETAALALRSLQQSAEQDWALFIRSPFGMEVITGATDPEVIKKIYVFATMTAHVKAMGTYLNAETLAYLNPLCPRWVHSTHPPAVAEGSEQVAVPHLLLKIKTGDKIEVVPGQWKVSPPADLLGETVGRGFWASDTGTPFEPENVLQWCYIHDLK